MRIAKPILLVSTPLGVAFGLVEGYRLAGGLVVLMAAMLGLMCVAAGTVVCTVRREQRAEHGRRPPLRQVDSPQTPPIRKVT